MGLAKTAAQPVGKFVQGLLPFFHLLTVIVRSGVPFLGALIVSFAVLQQAGAWLTFGVQRLIGPVPVDYVFLLSPLPGLITMVVVPMAQAMLLSVAYVRLRQTDEDMVLARPSGLSWKPVLALIVSLALAIGIGALKPGSPDPVYPMAAGQTVTLMAGQVSVDDLRVGRALTSSATDSGDDQPVASLGIFVAVRVSVGGYARATMYIDAETGGVSYPPWDNTLGSVGAPPGFRTSRDIVFEVPADSLADLVIRVTPAQSLPMTLPIGVFTIPADTPVGGVVTVDETPTTEVI